MSTTPLKIPLTGTRGDDLSYKFDNFKLNGVNYPTDVTVTFFATHENGTKNITATGSLSGSTLTVDIPRTDNDTEGKYEYEIYVTYANGDVLTHILSKLTIIEDLGG